MNLTTETVKNTIEDICAEYGLEPGPHLAAMLDLIAAELPMRLNIQSKLAPTVSRCDDCSCGKAEGCSPSRTDEQIRVAVAERDELLAQLTKGIP